MADLQPFHYLSSQDQIKPEYWESFEPIFTDFDKGQFSIGVGHEKVKRKIEALGYHCIEEGIGHDFEDKSGQYLWDKIKESFAEGGSVIYCKTNLHDGEFVWVKEIEDPIQLSFEMQKTKYYDGEYDDTEDQHRSNYDDVLKEIGLEMRDEMKDVDGEQAWTKEIMFNRYNGGFQKMWFTDAIIIPKPFNMSLPKWLSQAIKNALNRKV